jgi:hypothetical protein
MRSTLGTLGLALLLSAGQCSNETKIERLEPQQGTFAGGEEISIKGKNFPVKRGGVSVTFGRRAGTGVAIENDNTIKVISPQGEKNTDVDVTVLFDDGRGFQLKNAFRYLDATDNAKVMKNFGNKK